MYQIFADDTLIYDSTLEDYKIGKGVVSLETNKSGSFTFSLYPNHFYYNDFVRLKTVITVYKSGKIVFRGRILNDVTDYWNNRVFTCEGELGFLQDSIIRPFDFRGSPKNFFTQLITNHNSQVDEFKKFKIGEITVDDSTDIEFINSNYETSFDNLSGQLLEKSPGGYIYITHGDDGTDPIPTINYLAEFTKVATQTVEFGANLKDYTKTVNADGMATAIIPLGATLDGGDRLTVSGVNKGVDYVYSPEGVALYGWIFKTTTWDDETEPIKLLAKANSAVENLVLNNITLELTTIDLHLIDPEIEPFNLNDLIRAVSKPHAFDSILLCNKLTLDLLRPDNDTMTLGRTYSSFIGSTTSANKETSNAISAIKTEIKKTGELIDAKVESKFEMEKDSIILEVKAEVGDMSDELESIESRLALKVSKSDNNQIVSMLNASANIINLKSNRLVIDSDNFKLSANGSVEATDITLKNESGYYGVTIADGVISIDGPLEATGGFDTGFVRFKLLEFDVSGAKAALFAHGQWRADMSGVDFTDLRCEMI